MKKPRLLRTYTRTAHQDHGHCPQCYKLIAAGDQYEGWVSVFNGRLSVSKIHMFCDFDPIEDPEEIDLQDSPILELRRAA